MVTSSRATLWKVQRLSGLNTPEYMLSSMEAILALITGLKHSLTLIGNDKQRKRDISSAVSEPVPKLAES